MRHNMTVKIQNVADAAGVSVSTVSRTFARPDLVAKSTRTKVMQAAHTLNFHISRSAAALKSGQSLRIAVLTNDPTTEWFNSQILAGLDSVFHTAGYDISIYRITSGESRKAFFEELPMRRNVDAVIVCSFNIVGEEVAKLSEMNVPVIGINTPPEQGFNATVSIDDAEAVKAGVEHLISLGHRHIAYITVLNESKDLHFSSEARKKAFLRSCRSSSESINPYVLEADPGQDLTSTILGRLTSDARSCTAAFFESDRAAIPVLFRLRQYGIKVPDDFSILGFDDSLYADEIGLSTLHQDPFINGQSAAKKTMALIEGDPLEEPYEKPPVSLLLRETTAVCKKRA